MKRYSIFHPLVLSFFSGSLYRDVGQRWRGTGLAYLLLVLALFWIPTVIKMQSGLAQFVDHDSAKLTQQIPAITISRGKVSTDVATPYFIKDPDTGANLMIIDTTGEYQNLDETPARILLTKTKLIARSERDVRTYDLSGVKSFEVDRTKVEGWLATSKTWLPLALFPILVIGTFALRAIQILIYALVGGLFARMLNANLSYKTLMRLAAVAITPVIVLNLILEFLPVRIPMWWLIGTLIGLGYLFFAVKSNSETPPSLSYQPVVPYPPTQ